MTAWAVIAFLIASAVMTLLGYIVIDLLLFVRPLSRAVIWALAPGVGAGICSFVAFLFRRPMFTVEATLLITLVSVWLWRRGPPTLKFSWLTTPQFSILTLLLIGAIGWILSQSIERVERIPHGGWDGFAIWNSHARYLYRDGRNWQDHIQNTYHADYPLLVPSLVARIWRYSGADVPELGGLFGILFTFSGIAVLGSVLGELRGVPTGLFMALTLLTTPTYIAQGTSQYADVPLSFFFLATIALLCLHFEKEERRSSFLVLSGFMAGCACWTKNEGFLFVGAIFVVLFSSIFRNPRPTLRRIGLFSAGLVLPLAVVAFFKLTIAPTNDLISNRNYAEIVQKAMTLDRHAITLGNIISTSWTFGGWGIHPVFPLLGFLAFIGVDRSALRSLGLRAGVTTLAVVLVGYYWIYVLTPMDLSWHLDSSLSRLMTQLWPSAILLVGLAARSTINRTDSQPG